MKLLSIIVPVYNVEDYLYKCLKSLCMQDLDQDAYEIIIINDSSTDNSPQIAKDFASEHSNILYLSQKNKGLGATRNYGVQKASGKYIMFVDADDYIEFNVLKTLIDQLEVNELDLLRFNHREVDENYKVIPPNKYKSLTRIFSEQVKSGVDFLTQDLGWTCYACMFAMKRSILVNEKLYFKSGIYFEDLEWLPRILLHAKRVASINMHVYNYFRRSNSITKTINKAKIEKLINDRIAIIKQYRTWALQDKNISVNRWFSSMITLSVIRILGLISKIPEKEKEIVKNLKGVGVFPLKTHKLTKSQKRNVLIININPLLYIKLLKLSKYTQQI